MLLRSPHTSAQSPCSQLLCSLPCHKSADRPLLPHRGPPHSAPTRLVLPHAVYEKGVVLGRRQQRPHPSRVGLPPVFAELHRHELSPAWVARDAGDVAVDGTQELPVDVHRLPHGVNKPNWACKALLIALEAMEEVLHSKGGSGIGRRN